MVFWEIIKWLAGEKKKAEKAARYMSPEEAKQYVYKETRRKLNERLALEAKKALEIIEEAMKEEKDPKLKKLLEYVKKGAEMEISEEDPWDMNPSRMLLAIGLAEAIKHGIHKDPDKLTKYLLKHQYEAGLQVIKNIPYLPPWSEVKIGWNTVSFYISNLLSALRHAGYEEHAELVRKVLHKTPDNEDLWVKHPDLAHQEFTEHVKKELGLDWWDKSPEELLGIAKIPEHTGARELLKIALRETLPGWAIKQALDQAKIPLYTGPEGVHPSIIKYHIERSNPEHPRGTLLHTLTTRILAEWEREAARGEQPSHPYQTLAKLLGKDPIEAAKKPLTEQEAKEIAQKLGLPQTLTPETIRKTLLELARDLKQLQQGLKDPHLLDAEKETALRKHQLKQLAGDTTPHPYIKQIIREGKQPILQAYQEIKQTILGETQLGKEETAKALEKIEEILRKELDNYLTTINTQPISKTVAETTKKAQKQLEETLRDKTLATWATNLLRNILIDAPIIAAARNPRTQYLPLNEKKKIAAALLQYYEKNGEQHNIAPVTPDLHWMWQRITKAGEGLKGEEKKKAILEEIGKIRNIVNAIKAVGMDAYKIYTPLLDATNFNENGLLRHEVINKLYEAKRTLLETRYTGIVSSG